MKLNERHLMQLAAVLDTGGVSEGAAMLGMTQPAVSRSLAMLEARVGAPLFQKGRRPLQPTTLGAELAAHGRAILAASRMASLALRGYMRGSRGTVRVGGVPYFMDAMVSRLVAGFQRAEPEVTVAQSHGNAPDLAKALEGGQIDLAIVPLGPRERLAGFDFAELLPGRNVVACRPGHPLMRRTGLIAADLVAYPWVSPLPGSPLMTDLHAILASVGAEDLMMRYSGASLLSVTNYLAESNALAILPYAAVFAQRFEGRIAALPFDIPQVHRTLGILRRSGLALAPAVERFVDHLLAEFDDLRHILKREEAAAIRGGGG